MKGSRVRYQELTDVPPGADEVLQCPSCRRSHPLPCGGVVGLAQNYATADIVQFHQRESRQFSQHDLEQDGAAGVVVGGW